MADETTTELLKLDISVDIKKGLSEATRFQRNLTKDMKRVQDSVGKAGKGFVAFNKQLALAKTRTRGIKELTAQFKALDKLVKDRSELLLPELQKARKMKRGSQERKDAMARVAELKNTTGLKGASSLRRGAASGIKELQSTSAADRKVLRKGAAKEGQEERKNRIREAEEAGEEYAQPLRDLLSKDAPTLMKRMATVFMAAGSRENKVRARAMRLGGHRLSKRGSEMMKQGGVKGIIGGAAAKAGGGLMKMFGSLANVITSIGPMLSLATSFMMGFVKIMIEAESATKEFNKQILSTTGSSGYLSRNMGDVGKASDDLSASLDAVQKGALNSANAMMGISKETAMAFVNAVTAEGVSLDRLGKATGEATVSAETHAKTIQAGVLYSRAFGVSLSEISQMQGQLMADLGMGAETVQASFQTIVEGAHDAGMETNKFFGIVRSFSSDLGLFTLRLADVSKIMGVLGKTMDPRKMGQFLQMLNQKFSGGLMDNLKFTMMAGPEGTKIAKDDAAKKLTNLTNDLKATLGSGQEKEIDKLIALLKNPNRDPRAIAKWQSDHQTDLNQTLNESIQDNGNLQKKIASGDKIDQASIMESLSPLAKKKTLEAAAMKMTGRSFDKLSGLSLAAVEATGIASAKEIQMLQKLDQGIMQGQEELIARVSSGKMTDADKAQVARLKVEGKTNTEIAAALRAKFEGAGGADAYMDSLDKSNQELLVDSAKEIDFQKETAGFQTSMMDRLANLTDVLINKIYHAMLGMLELMKSIYALMPGNAQGKITSSVNAGKGSKVAEIRDAFKSLSDKSTHQELTDAKNKVIEGSGKRLLAEVDAAHKEYAQLKDKSASEKDSKKRAAMLDRMQELEPAQQYSGNVGSNGKPTQFSLYDEANQFGVPAMLNTLQDMDKALSGSRKGGGQTPATAMGKGISPTDIARSVTTNSSIAPAGTLAALQPGAMRPNAMGGPATAAVGGVGGMKVELELKGDFKRFVNARVVEGAANHDRNKRVR